MFQTGRLGQDASPHDCRSCHVFVNHPYTLKTYLEYLNCASNGVSFFRNRNAGTLHARDSRRGSTIEIWK